MKLDIGFLFKIMMLLLNTDLYFREVEYRKDLREYADKVKTEAVEKFNSSMGIEENIKINPKKIKIKIREDSFVKETEGMGCGGYCMGNRIIISDKYVREQVVIHEVAHAIDNQIRGSSCHDEYWQKINDCMGGEPNYLERAIAHYGKEFIMEEEKKASK